MKAPSVGRVGYVVDANITGAVPRDCLHAVSPSHRERVGSDELPALSLLCGVAATTGRTTAGELPALAAAVRAAVVRDLVSLEDQCDATQFQPVTMVKACTIGGKTVHTAGGGDAQIDIHPLVFGSVPPNHSVFRFEAGQPYVLRVGAADGDQVSVEGELLLDAGSFRAAGNCVPAGGDDEARMPGARGHATHGGALR
jgi:hypothetical protein